MPRTPGAERSNRDDATTSPTSTNDETEGWDVGSRWVNVNNGSVWFAVDVSTGAAIWKDVTASGSGGITDAQHKALRDLIHFIDEGPADGFASGSYKETTYNGVFPTVIDWWEDVTKTQRIVDLTITYTGAFPTTEVWRMYDTDGVTVLVTLTDTITYNGALEATRTRTWV